ncbi:phage recombination protein Bet [Fluviispira vulneris]|uniref:phage recombination protein Bet n=1 Tax=Fluviispira vulneris TaxID=2763012 RepID=UPI0016488A2A|nr:phage recombination protein Bet [Fluviispira vulneris]
MTNVVVRKENSVVKKNDGSVSYFTKEEETVIKGLISPKATDAEFKLFLYVCARTGLDPFSRQIYLIHRWSTKDEKEIGTIQTSIDGFRTIAARNPDYAGQTTTLFCGRDGVWTEIWTSKDYPYAAKVGVYRKGYSAPTYAIAKWDSYVQTYKDKKTQKFYVSAMWEKFPELMLGKCAESQALRKAFPNDLSGLYTTDEMAQAQNEAIEAPVIKEETKKIEPVKNEIVEQKVDPKKPAVQQKIVANKIAQSQKVLDKMPEQKSVDAELVDDEQYNNENENHRAIFKSIMKALESIKSLDQKDIKNLVAVYKQYSNLCLGVPLNKLESHIKNLEKEFAKETAA